jgi:hypothetical protein
LIHVAWIMSLLWRQLLLGALFGLLSVGKIREIA